MVFIFDELQFVKLLFTYFENHRLRIVHMPWKSCCLNHTRITNQAINILLHFK